MQSPYSRFLLLDQCCGKCSRLKVLAASSLTQHQYPKVGKVLLIGLSSSRGLTAQNQQYNGSDKLLSTTDVAVMLLARLAWVKRWQYC
jgi:hypothetical protein